MPTVKRYDQLQVQEQALPSARVSTSAPIEAFGGGKANAAEAVGGLAGTIGKIAEEEKKKADDVATTDFYAKAATIKNSLMYDPKSGAMTKQGKNAFGVVDEYGQQFDQQMGDLEKDLHNDDQRAMAAKIKSKIKLDLDNDLQRHVAAESEKFDNETTKSGLEVAKNDAIMNYQTPGKVRENIELQKSIINNFAERNGKGEDWIKASTAEATSGTHSSVIDRMLANGQDLAAQKYFDQVKPELSSKDIVGVEKAVEEGSTRGESMRMSDSIYASNQGNMSAAMDEARKIENPKVQDATVARLKDRYTLEKTEQRQYEEDLHKKAGNIIDQTGTVDNIPPAEWSQFSVSDKAALKSYARTKLEGDDPRTDEELYYDLQGLASSPATRNDFAKINLMAPKYLNHLSKKDRRDFIDIQASLRKGKADEKLLDGFQTDKDIVNTSLTEIGVDPTPKPGSGDAKRVAEFKREVERQQIKIQTDTGKKATNEQIQSIVDNLRVKGDVPGTGWFGIFKTQKRIYEAEPGQPLDIPFKEIPKSEANKIRDSMLRFKKPISDEGIRQIYLQRLKGTTGRGAQ